MFSCNLRKRHGYAWFMFHVIFANDMAMLDSCFHVVFTNDMAMLDSCFHIIFANDMAMLDSCFHVIFANDMAMLLLQVWLQPWGCGPSQHTCDCRTGHCHRGESLWRVWAGLARWSSSCVYLCVRECVCCVCACMRVCVWCALSACTKWWVCLRVCVCVHCLHALSGECVYAYVCMCVCVCALSACTKWWVCVCVSVCVCVN